MTQKSAASKTYESEAPKASIGSSKVVVGGIITPSRLMDPILRRCEELSLAHGDIDQYMEALVFDALNTIDDSLDDEVLRVHGSLSKRSTLGVIRVSTITLSEGDALALQTRANRIDLTPQEYVASLAVYDSTEIQASKLAARFVEAATTQGLPLNPAGEASQQSPPGA